MRNPAIELCAVMLALCLGAPAETSEDTSEVLVGPHSPMGYVVNTSAPAKKLERE